MDKTARPQDTARQPFVKLPIEVRVTVGRARPTIEELLALAPESLLHLDRSVTDPVELYVGDKLIARGQLEELDDGSGSQLAVRLTEVADDAQAL